MEWDFYWNEDPKCPAKVLAAEHKINLGSNSAVMCTTRRTGEMIFMIKTTDNPAQHYMWNIIEDSLVKIDHKGGQTGIIADMKADGVSSLTMTVV